MDLISLLSSVASGDVTPEEGARQVRTSYEADLGFAHVDLDRARRCGMSEVIFCPGKTAGQVVEIASALLDAGQNVLATRADRDLFEAVLARHAGAKYFEDARAILIDPFPRPDPVGCVAVVSAGTSDTPVASEAAITAEHLGARVESIKDVGVAGLHRLFPHLPLLKQSRVIVVVAGMEGALPSVIGGLVNRPIIAVPTSVGYGAHLHGLAPLLSMLNTCVPGISVVNIDNGFGAGVCAALINRVGEPT